MGVACGHGRGSRLAFALGLLLLVIIAWHRKGPHSPVGLDSIFWNTEVDEAIPAQVPHPRQERLNSIKDVAMRNADSEVLESGAIPPALLASFAEIVSCPA